MNERCRVALLSILAEDLQKEKLIRGFTLRLVHFHKIVHALRINRGANLLRIFGKNCLIARVQFDDKIERELSRKEELHSALLQIQPSR